MRAVVVLSTCFLLIFGVYGEMEPWKYMSVYQIYPRSFKDSDGDGIGDIRGIISKLQYLVDSNFNAIWLSPIYPSPMVDFGYDITDFIGIDPLYGTMKDFEDLLEAAHNLSIRVFMDFVPNHTSDQHEWFKKSVKGIEPYKDFFIWDEGKMVNGVRQPPNNWCSIFYGSAWTWNEERQAYYFHQFIPDQPDLNFRNEKVVEEIKDVLRFWLDKGVDGFRMDAIQDLFEVEDLRDEPLTGLTDDPKSYDYTHHVYTTLLDEMYYMLRQWRDVLDEYDVTEQQRVMMIEVYANTTMTMRFFEYGAHFPFNFGLIMAVDNQSSAKTYKGLVDEWWNNLPPGAASNWVAGNHDKRRLVNRFGVGMDLAVVTLVNLLPGVAVTYYGEEIGMENTWLSWDETQDPQGCNAGVNGYEKASRDPERTPFQWDNTTSAGFSTNPKPWLQVNENYKTNNLAAQKAANRSHYKSYQKISDLRKWPAVKEGSLETRLLNDSVFAFSRELQDERPIYVAINVAHEPQVVNLRDFKSAPSKVQLYHSTSDTNVRDGDIVDSDTVQIPARGAAIFTTVDFSNKARQRLNYARISVTTVLN